MRHLQIGRKLGVGPDRRVALLRSLTLSLIEHEQIRTTPARAKELRWFADRVVTLAKRGDVAGRRRIIQLLGSSQTYVPGKNRIRMAVDRIYTQLVPRFKGRDGGYTQMIRLATRRAGDNAELCVMQYIPAPDEKKKGGKKEGKEKKAAAKGKAEAKHAHKHDDKHDHKHDKTEKPHKHEKHDKDEKHAAAHDKKHAEKAKKSHDDKAEHKHEDKPVKKKKEKSE